MRFIGNKRNLIDDIESFARKHIDAEVLERGCFLDLFGGTNTVANHFKRFMPVITNDSMYFSYVMSRGTTTLNEAPDFLNLLNELNEQDVLAYLNDIDVSDLVSGFITSNYTLQNSDRNYMSIENGMRVDTIRVKIENWRNLGLINEDGYYYLLCCLLEAVSDISNTKGSYSAFLAKVDSRSLKPLILEHPILINNNIENKAYQLDAIALTSATPTAICYIDPPYGRQQYTSNYHLLETICLYDDPDIKGKTGIRSNPNSEKSKFCSNTHASQEFFNLIEACQSPHIVISYTSRGILDLEVIKQALVRFCEPESIVVHRFDYHTYKGDSIKRDDDHCEYLIYGFKSNLPLPLNPIMDSNEISYSLATDPKTYTNPAIQVTDSQLHNLNAINSVLPHNISTFIDAFCGDMSASLNVDAKRIVANDANQPLISMFEYLSSAAIGQVIENIYSVIDQYQLSRVNEEGFLDLRRDYNKKPSAVYLYLLICHSYDQMLRFNLQEDYNGSFGRDRSFFSNTMLRNLIRFSDNIKKKDVSFYSMGFTQLFDIVEPDEGTIFYCNPPSTLLAKDSDFNSRGFNNWNSRLELQLHRSLNEINNRGYKFILIDSIKYRDVINKPLKSFGRKYSLLALPQNNDDIQQVLIKNY